MPFKTATFFAETLVHLVCLCSFVTRTGWGRIEVSWNMAILVVRFQPYKEGFLYERLVLIVKTCSFDKKDLFLPKN